MEVRSKNNRGLKVLSNIGFTIFMLIIIILIFIAGQSRLTGMEPSLLGHRMYVVDSGSMTPTIAINSLIIVKEKQPSEIKENDVITYYGESGDTRVTHRVMEIEGNGDSFITKGDANNTEDFIPIEKEQVIGTVDYSIPYLGLVLRFLSSKFGIVFILVIGVLSFLIPIIVRKIRPKKAY